jgi:hypothetical protein
VARWTLGSTYLFPPLSPINWVPPSASVFAVRLLGRVSAARGAIVGGLFGAEMCLYLALAIFGAQASDPAP